MSEPTVLVVDDNEPVADTYAVLLDAQYNTKVAYTGEGGLEKLDSSVDVMVLDRRMPGYSGDEVLTDVREEGWDCSVIFLSAVEKDANRKVTADDYLKKPAERRELLNTVERNSR